MSYRDERPALGPIEQFFLNCVISAVLAGITFGIGNGAFDADWPGKVYWVLFGIWLLLCYGWVVIVHFRKERTDNSSSSSGSGGGSGTDWLDF